MLFGNIARLRGIYAFTLSNTVCVRRLEDTRLHTVSNSDCAHLPKSADDSDRAQSETRSSTSYSLFVRSYS